MSGEGRILDRGRLCEAFAKMKKEAVEQKSRVLDRGRRLEPSRRAKETEGWAGRADRGRSFEPLEGMKAKLQ